MPDQPPDTSTESVPAIVIHPGDLIQVTDRLHPWFVVIAMVEQTRAWGVELMITMPISKVNLRERAKPAQVVVVGVAALMPPDVMAARRDSIATAEAVAREARDAQQG